MQHHRSTISRTRIAPTNQQIASSASAEWLSMGDGDASSVKYVDEADDSLCHPRSMNYAGVVLWSCRQPLMKNWPWYTTTSVIILQLQWVSQWQARCDHRWHWRFSMTCYLIMYSGCGRRQDKNFGTRFESHYFSEQKIRTQNFSCFLFKLLFVSDF